MSNDKSFNKNEKIEIYYITAFRLCKAVKVNYFYNCFIIYSHFSIKHLCLFFDMFNNINLCNAIIQLLCKKNYT